MKTDCSKRTNYNMHCIKPANVFFCCGMRVDSMSEILLHLHNTLPCLYWSTVNPFSERIPSWAPNVTGPCRGTIYLWALAWVCCYII